MNGLILDVAHGKNVSGKRSPDGEHREYLWSRNQIKKLMHRFISISNLPFYFHAPFLDYENEPGLIKRVIEYNRITKAYDKTFMLSLHNDANHPDKCDSDGYGEGHGMAFHRNLCYDNQYYVDEPLWAGIKPNGEWYPSVTAGNNTYTRNILIARDSSEVGVAWGGTENPINELDNILDTNYYFNPFSGDDYMFGKLEGINGWSVKTAWELSDVQGGTTWEDHGTYNQANWTYDSIESPSITRDQFVFVFYNWSETAHTFDLGDCTLADTAGTEVDTEIEVDPYGYEVLFYKSGTYATIETPLYEPVEAGSVEGERTPYYKGIQRSFYYKGIERKLYR